MKKINKFYVGADHIARAIASGKNDGWTWATLEGAVKHAKEILEEDNDKEAVVIVQVIRIVRRQKPPVIIEKVR